MATLEVTDLISMLQMVEANKKGHKDWYPGAMAKGAGMGRRDVPPAPEGSDHWLYGNGLFSFCGDNDIVSLLIRDESFLNWLNWVPNMEKNRFIKTLSWVGPDGSNWEARTPTHGTWHSDVCTPPHSVEWGKCELLMTKGRYGRCGQTISATEVIEKYCNIEPIYRIDGSVVDNEAEWQLALAGMVLKDDVSQHLITGDSANENQMDGLEKLIRTGYADARNQYPCSQVDSIVVDWANAGVSGLEVLLGEIINRIKQRAKAQGGINASRDMAIMLPSVLRDCLVNLFACEGPCGSGIVAAAGAININSTARADRDRYLTGGANGDGWIPINGEPISFLINDWIPFQSCVGGGADSYSSDVYILTRRIGAREVLRGEYLDLTKAQNLLGEWFGKQFRVTDGGKFLVYSKVDETCFNTCLITRPGLFLSAPWAQARITDVCCTKQLKPLSPDISTEYFEDFDELYKAEAPSGFQM